MRIKDFKKDIPIKDQSVTVLHVQDDAITYAITQQDKRAMVAAQAEQGGRLVAVWTGQYQGYAFDLPPSAFAAATV